jgi:hypothetical protein
VDSFFQTIGLIQALNGELSVQKRVMHGAELGHLFGTQFTIRGYPLLLIGEIGIHQGKSSVLLVGLKFTGCVVGK